MRRSSSRSSGAGRPVALSRSVGRTSSGRSSLGGSMVAATGSSITVAGHVMPERNPLSARSVVASTLLGMHPPVLSARVLVKSGELFGIAEGTTRTALSRMVNAGELVVEDRSYRLAGRLLERQARQDVSRK